MKPRLRPACVLAMSLACSVALGASAQAPPAPKVSLPPCSAPELRQFDFWLGEWEVYQPDGKLAGTNSIKALHGKCGLHETWSSVRGGGGQSFNTWDAIRKVWHQTWVDAIGSLLVIEGGMKDGSMVMNDAMNPRKPDPKVIQEISWTPQADGSVRQHWRASTDGGKTWKTAFDGKYVRKKR